MKKRNVTLSPIVLRLQESKISADRFLKLTQAFLGLVRNVSDTASGKKDGVIWMVTAQSGSMIISAAPEPYKADQATAVRAVKAIQKGLVRLESKGTRPEFFSDTSLYHLRELSALVSDGSSGVGTLTIRHENQQTQITGHTYANVNSIIEAAWTESGSVEGKVAVLADRGGLVVQIDDILTGQTVKCAVSGDLADKLIKAFRKRVLVSGNVHYRKDGVPVSIEVSGVRLIGGKNLPGFDDVRGILSE